MSGGKTIPLVGATAGGASLWNWWAKVRRDASRTPRWEKLEDRETYTLHRVTYATEPGLDAFAFVGIPHGIKGRVPAVLCPHGHGKTGARYVAAYGDDPRVAAEVKRYKGDYGHRNRRRGRGLLSAADHG